jgi:hypothetical protein
LPNPWLGYAWVEVEMGMTQRWGDAERESENSKR